MINGDIRDENWDDICLPDVIYCQTMVLPHLQTDTNFPSWAK